MKNKTTITVETWKQTVVRKGRPRAFWCHVCEVGTEMFTPDEIARFAKITTREIYRRVENNTFHFVETPDGALFVCSNSIQKSQNRLSRPTASGNGSKPGEKL